NATAGFYGITGKHTRAHLLRSVYEGIAYSTYMQVKQLREVVKVKEIRIAGGGSKSRIWTKILTDVMNLPIKVPKGSELGARGAALCAGVGVGVFKDHRSALEEFTSIVYEQTPDKEDVKKYFKFYQLFEKSIKQAEVIWNGLETIRSTL
ncbi:FGGY-family carbohydrate kinase, partial [[Eubacterium] cellulosolvens]